MSETWKSITTGESVPTTSTLRHGGSADQLLGLTGRKAPYKIWLTSADREQVILIAPNGISEDDGKQSWNDARNIPDNPDSDDVSFLKTLVDVVSASHKIEKQRVYAMGTSNGGHMSLRLAAEASDVFSAVAAVAAANILEKTRPDHVFLGRLHKID